MAQLYLASLMSPTDNTTALRKKLRQVYLLREYFSNSCCPNREYYLQKVVEIEQILKKDQLCLICEKGRNSKQKHNTTSLQLYKEDDDAFCLELYKQYQADPEQGNFVSFEDAARQLDILTFKQEE